MLDIRRLNDKAMKKYNLEMHTGLGCSDGGFFLNIANSDWWVMGIDESKNIVYAQIDGSMYFDGVGYHEIRRLAQKDYVIIDICDEYVKGMDSTRVNECEALEDVKDFIQAKCVYILKYVGINMENEVI